MAISNLHQAVLAVSFATLCMQCILARDKNLSCLERLAEDDNCLLPLNPQAVHGGVINGLPTDYAAVFSTEREAFDLAWCYAACVQNFKDEVKVSGTETVWPTVGIRRLPCSQTIVNIMECTRGCLRMSLNQDLTLSNCSNDCVMDCRKQSFSYRSSPCQERTQCEDTEITCRTGCQLYTDAMADSGSRTTNIPIPTSSPHLIRESTSRAGIFSIMEYSIPPLTGAERDTNFSITTFVFKVKTKNKVRYIPLSSLEEFLDLGFVACKEVNVSFAVISSLTSQFPLSYSPPLTNLCVHGDSYPTQLGNPFESVKIVEIEEDLRDGFRQAKRAILNIKWEKPEGYRYVTGYKLTMTSSCGLGIKELFFDRENRSVRVRADSPSELPAFSPVGTSPCKYLAEFQVLPLRPGDSPLMVLSLGYSHLKVKPIQEFNIVECSSDHNATTGLVSVRLSWTIKPDELPFSKLEALKYIHVLVSEGSFQDEDFVKLTADIRINETGEERSLLVNNNGHKLDALITLDRNASGTLTIDGFIPISQDHIFEVQISYMKDLLSFHYRSTPSPTTCFIAAHPLAPDPIDPNNIAINAFNLLGNLLTLDLSWDLPNGTYGDIVGAEVRVLTIPDPKGSNLLENDYLVFTKVLETGEPGFSIASEDVPLINNMTLCLFLQVRLENSFMMVSNWSESLTLPTHQNVSNCTITIPADVMLTIPTSSNHNWVFISSGTVGGALLVILLAVCLPLTIFLCKNYLRKKHMMKLIKSPKIILPGVSDPLHRNESFLLTGDKWEVPASDILLEEEIGNGFFGTVYKGIVQRGITDKIGSGMGQEKSHYYRVIVAIKMLKAKANNIEKTQFFDEINLMKKIASGNNPHVVRLIGCVTLSEPHCLLTEYVCYGDLHSYLKSIKSMVSGEQSNGYVSNSKDSGYADLHTYNNSLLSVTPSVDSPYAKLGQVEITDLMSFAFQVASGMEYIADLSIIHCDLACRNVLIGEDKTLKIADFGMSRTVSSDNPLYVKRSHGHLPFKWMAIESIQDMVFTTASDVWSYGILLWEIATLGSFPYQSVPGDQLLEYLIAGHRLECPPNCKQEIYQVMHNCWKEEPAERPSFQELSSTFSQFLQEKSHFIEFPSKEVESKPILKPHHPPANVGKCSVDGYALADAISRSRSVSPFEGQFLNVDIGPRRPFSEPALDPGEDNLDLGSNENLKKSYSNPYVRTPRQDSIFKIRKKFVWKEEPPKICIEGYEDDGYITLP